MRPSARLSAVQELLEPLSRGPDFLPVDQALSNYLRNRRYIGSKDRRAIRDIFYMILHCWQALAFILGEEKAPLTGRNLLLAFLKTGENFDETLFGEGEYGLAPLSEAEKRLLGGLKDGAILPEWAACNCPEWLYPKFQERFGGRTGEELEALNRRAPVDIRINTLKGANPDLVFHLKGLGFNPCPLVRNAFRSDEQIQLTASDYYKKGDFEFQDEGSQAASLLVAAEPDMQVLDLCAGAGGKTLALAAEMQNKGQIYAFDIHPGKIKTLKERAQKAGVRNLQAAALPETGPERERILREFHGKMERVLLDVPCSGTGVWRRKPDTRLRLTPEKLAGYKKAQAALLAEGAGLVKRHGHLVYVTCSLLAEENEEQIKAFLKENSGWALADYRGLLGKNPPETLASIKETLVLTPARHATDGFFIAILENRGEGK